MEVAQEQKERLIPEAELMVQLGVVNAEQMRECNQKREDYYAKINSGNRSVVDYIQFIVYEKKFLKWIVEHDDISSEALPVLKNLIVKRITTLFRNCLDKFPHDERIIQSYIKFTKIYHPELVLSIYEKWLKYHSEDIRLWGEAALWAYEQKIDGLAKTTDIFMRGIDRHPSDCVLYKLFFDVLLTEAAKMSAEPVPGSAQSEQEVGLRKVELLYDQSKQHIKTIPFHISLLERCEYERFQDMTAALQYKICVDLIRVFGKDPELWEAFAQRDLRGYNLHDLFQKFPIPEGEHFGEGSVLQKALQDQAQLLSAEKAEKNADEDKIATEDNDESGSRPKSIWVHRSLKKRIKLGCTVLQSAVLILKTEEACAKYIDTMLQLNDRNYIKGPDPHLSLKRQCLAVAFNLGHQMRLMSVDHYAAFFQCLLKSPQGSELADQVFSEAVNVHKTPRIYEMMLNAYMEKDSSANVVKILQQGTAKLGANSDKLWRLALAYFKTHYEDEPKQLMALYRSAATTPHANFLPFRVDFLEFSLLNQGTEKAFEIYNKLRQLPPPCLQLHQKMAANLKLLLPPNDQNTKRLRTIYSLMSTQFGKTHIEVWVDFIKFERERGDPMNIAAMVTRARAALKGELLQEFETTYALMTTNDV